jgi:hypothetical protein
MAGLDSVPALNYAWIKDHTTAKTVGWSVLILGFLLVYNAYDGRGAKHPWWLGSFLPY